MSLRVAVKGRGVIDLLYVELLCGPILFADGFESGLTTHWSATVFRARGSTSRAAPLCALERTVRVR